MRFDKRPACRKRCRIELWDCWRHHPRAKLINLGTAFEREPVAVRALASRVGAFLPSHEAGRPQVIQLGDNGRPGQPRPARECIQAWSALACLLVVMTGQDEKHRLPRAAHARVVARPCNRPRDHLSPTMRQAEPLDRTTLPNCTRSSRGLSVKLGRRAITARTPDATGEFTPASTTRREPN